MVKRIMKNILKPPFKILHKNLEVIEKHLIMSNYEPTYSPIFIIGVPRSGTTLLYQLMTYCLKVCYISNLIEKYSNLPCTFSYFLSLLNGCNPPSSFDSRYGETDGWRSPSQGWNFWDRWFSTGDQNYLALHEVPIPTIKKLRNTILLMENIYNRPFVNKALSLGVRILPLNEAFPEALFIRVHRNHLDIAQSILKGRKEYSGDKNNWISAKPSEYEKIKDKDYITQICGQIYYLEKDIKRDIRIIGINRCIDVNYDDLCNNPKSILEKITQFYNENTCNGVLRGKNAPPDSFHLSRGRKCDDNEYNRLKECLNSFYNEAP